MEKDCIKYIADRFYLILDGFHLQNLNSFVDDATFSQQQAIYLHEYYHYLTNLTTFEGLREFNIVFQDKIRIITRISSKRRLGAFPIKNNLYSDCKDDIDYWKEVDKISKSDDLDLNFVEELDKSIEKKFDIVAIHKINESLSCKIGTQIFSGARVSYKIKTTQITTSKLTDEFILTIGVIDEFLCAAIDEYMFLNDLADNCEVIRNRSFYPYLLFDEFLEYYGLKDNTEPMHKILIAYCALHSVNPVSTFIELLENISNNNQSFYRDPEQFLRDKHINYTKKEYFEKLEWILHYEFSFIEECQQQGRRNLRDTIVLLFRKSWQAYEHLKNDFFYFVRPFMIGNIKTGNGRKKLLALFKNIRAEMEEPLILQDHKLLDSTPYANHLAMLVAIYEIMDSLYSNNLATRTCKRKNKYSFPVEGPEDDKIENMPDYPPLTHTWHVALNELGLYGEYIKLKKK